MQNTIINRLLHPNSSEFKQKQQPQLQDIREEHQVIRQNERNYRRANSLVETIKSLFTGALLGAIVYGGATIMDHVKKEKFPEKKAIEQIIGVKGETSKAALKNYLLDKPKVLDEILTDYETFERLNKFLFLPEIVSNSTNHVCLEATIMTAGKHNVHFNSKDYLSLNELSDSLIVYPAFNLFFDEFSKILYQSQGSDATKKGWLRLQSTEVSQVAVKSNQFCFVSGTNIFSRTLEGQVHQELACPVVPTLKSIDGTDLFYASFAGQGFVLGPTESMGNKESDRIKRNLEIIPSKGIELTSKSKIKYHNGTIFVNSGNIIYCSDELKNSQYKQIRTEGNITDFTFFDVNADGKDEIILASDGPLFEPGAIEVYRVDKKIFSLKHTTYGLSFPKPFNEQDAYFIHQKDFKTRILKKLQGEKNGQ